MVSYKTHELKSFWDRLVLYWYFPLQSLVYFTKMLGSSVNNFIGIPLNLLFILLSSKEAFYTALDRNKSQGDKLVLFFLIYSLLSGILTVLGGFQLECYTASLKIFIIPILFYFWGRNTKDVSCSFYKFFIWTCFISMLIGLFLYLTMPSFYSAYLLQSYQESWMRQGSEATANMIIDTHRFSAFFSSSYSVCFFAVPALVIVLGCNVRGLMKSLLGKYAKTDLLFYVIVAVLVVSSILSLQRIAMVCSVAIVIFYFFYGAKQKFSKNIATYIAIVVGIAFVSLSIIPRLAGNRNDAISENVSLRMDRMDIDDAMSARTGQYKFVGDNLEKYIIIGTGLGSAGNKAAELGHKGVTDGEFVRMFAELGSVGCVVFWLLIIVTISRGVRNFKLYNTEIVIIGFFLLAGIGANSLSMNLWSGIFWYSIGRIWNRQYRDYNYLSANI